MDSQVIINLPKFKTHNLTTITGAIKNMFGVVPGFTKVGYHLRFDDINVFTGMLLDIVMLVKPTLNIMDGILGIEGEIHRLENALAGDSRTTQRFTSPSDGAISSDVRWSTIPPTWFTYSCEPTANPSVHSDSRANPPCSIARSIQRP